jgi:hypothetical protein
MEVTGQQHAPSALSPVSTEQGTGWATSRLDALEVFGTGWKLVCWALLRCGIYGSLYIVPPQVEERKVPKPLKGNGLVWIQQTVCCKPSYIHTYRIMKFPRANSPCGNWEGGRQVFKK